MKVNGLKDDFICVKGENCIEYSRETRNSKTRIDYILSNTNGCIFFEYVDIKMGLDHKIAVANYDIEVTMQKEHIPKGKYFKTWVISKDLEEDLLFLDHVKYICDLTKEEIMEEEIENREIDISIYWKILKDEIVKCAKRREGIKRKEEN